MREVSVALMTSFYEAINRSSIDDDDVDISVRFSGDGADWALRPTWSGLQDLFGDGIGRSYPGDPSYLFVFQCL